MKLEAIDQKEHLRRKTEHETAVSDLAVAESTLHSMGLDQAAVDALLAGAAKGGDHLDHYADPDLRLVSPLDGRVVLREVVMGQHVQPEMRLFTVSDLSTLWAWLDAREADLPHVETGRPVRIRTSVYPERSWPGTVLQVGDIVDEKTRTVKLRVEVRNDGALKPNMYIQGEIPGAQTTRNVVAIPEAAIQTLEGNPVVFVREEADRFVPRPIELADRIGGRRVVLRGLEAGEHVAVGGAFKLKAELLKATIAGDEHGHGK
jgi:RND family efflux transporter MFP subunit